MPTTLYDVYTVTPGTTVAGQFYLRAPLETLRHLWNLHDSACSRIVRETTDTPQCLLHDNRRGRFPSEAIAVKRVAVDELTIHAAVTRACTQWLEGGTQNLDRMRELIDTIVGEACEEFQTNNVAVTTDEEDEGYPI